MAEVQILSIKTERTSVKILSRNFAQFFELHHTRIIFIENVINEALKEFYKSHDGTSC